MITPFTLGYELGRLIIYGGMGFVFGWIGRGIKEKYQSSVDNVKIITLSVLFIYVLSILYAMLNPTYQTPVGLHGIMGIVAGYYFKQAITK